MRRHPSHSSVPGGVFALAPDAQVRDRLDGQAGGRGNSSSVAGGIFGAPAMQPLSNAQANGAMPSMTGDGGFKNGGFGGGYAKQNSSVWEGAAGGRSTNAAQSRDGHFRGGTMGGGAYTAAVSGQDSARGSGFSLDQLERAEHRDAIEQVKQPTEAECEMVAAAAEQIAAEQGLGDEERYKLEATLMARLHERSGYFQFSKPGLPADDSI